MSSTSRIRVLADPRVRTAIAAAIDKNALTRQLTYGQATTATEDIPDWMWAFDPAVKSVPFDPDAAKAMLADAGWIAGPDGIVRKNGRPLELLLATNSTSATERSLSLLIQAALRRIGIAVSIKYYLPDILYAPKAMGGIQHGGKFDLLVYGWYAGIDPDNSSQLTCNNFPPHGYNDPRYCSRAMDAAQEHALTRYDRATRKARLLENRAAARDRQSDRSSSGGSASKRRSPSTSTASTPTRSSNPGTPGNGVF